MEPRRLQVHRDLSFHPWPRSSCRQALRRASRQLGFLINGQDDKDRVINYEYSLVYGLDGKIDESNPAAADWISVRGEALFAPLNVLELVESRWAGHNQQSPKRTSGRSTLQRWRQSAAVRAGSAVPARRGVRSRPAQNDRRRYDDGSKTDPGSAGSSAGSSAAVDCHCSSGQVDLSWPRGAIARSKATAFKQLTTDKLATNNCIDRIGPLNQIDPASFRFRHFRHGCSSLTAPPDDESVRLVSSRDADNITREPTRWPTTGNHCRELRRVFSEGVRVLP